MIQEYKGKIIQLIKAIISVVIIFFIVEYTKMNVDALNNFEFRLNYFYLTISFIILLIYIFNQFVLWYYITKQNQCSIGFFKSIISRAYSEFGKYVPGKVFGYAMLLYTYTKAKQSKKLVAFCIFLELFVSMLAAALIFLFSLFFTDILNFQKYRIAALILLLFFFVLIHPKILNYFTTIFFKISKREPIKLNISCYQLLKIVSLYVVNLMVFGVAFVLFINSIYSVPFSNFLYVAGTTVAAGLIGLFAIFVPAGLGVREGVMVFTLSFIIPPTFAGIVALTSRIWLTLGEIFLFSFIFLKSKSQK
jgi:hypothetical protein